MEVGGVEAGEEAGVEKNQRGRRGSSGEGRGRGLSGVKRLGEGRDEEEEEGRGGDKAGGETGGSRGGGRKSRDCQCPRHWPQQKCSMLHLPIIWGFVLVFLFLL